MERSEYLERRGERFKLLTATTQGSEMGRLLRRFWHPVALARKVQPGTMTPLRLFGEEMTLYRGASGKPYLIGGRCAHRGTLLQSGWVEGECVRCIYHGWKYDGSGQCVERPAEKDKARPEVRIAGYKLHEYCGMIFAYLGEGEAPVFELPRKPAFERPGVMLFPRAEIWDCNWFQHIENSMDATHVSFVHRMGKIGTFGEAVTQTIPELEYLETDAGIRQIATRSVQSVRISDWTFPNHNHINQPGLSASDPWVDIGTWMIPIDDTSTLRFTLWVVPNGSAAADRRAVEYFERIDDYTPQAHHEALFRGEYPDDLLVCLTNAQDYVAQVGQGAVADREHEYLGRSDAGIVFLRNLFWRELDAIRAGRPAKAWRSLSHAADMPIQRPETADA